MEIEKIEEDQLPIIKSVTGKTITTKHSGPDKYGLVADESLSTNTCIFFEYLTKKPTH